VTGVCLYFTSATPEELQTVLGGLQLMAIQPQLDRIEAKLGALQLQETQDMAALDDQITSLTTQVANNTSVTGSAQTMISGFAALLATAVANAKGAGATPAQLASFAALQSTITQNDTALAAAIAQNTPAAAGAA
jgi:hypothetical protein